MMWVETRQIKKHHGEPWLQQWIWKNETMSSSVPWTVTKITWWVASEIIHLKKDWLLLSFPVIRTSIIIFAFDVALTKNIIVHFRQEMSNHIAANISKALIKYHEINGVLPERILFFRDGVGEGQVSSICLFCRYISLWQKQWNNKNLFLNRLATFTVTNCRLYKLSWRIRTWIWVSKRMSSSRI